MDDPVVDSKFTAPIVNDENTDTATTIVKGISEAFKELTLVEDRKALFDVTGLSHGDDAAITTDVQNAVLLEDRAKHVLYNDRWRWVGNEARLFMELLREEVNTEITVLACLGRGGDTDDLARAALKDEKVANANVVAGDGDGVWHRTASVVAVRFGVVRAADFTIPDDDFFAVDFVVAVMTAAVDRVDDVVSSSLQTTAEGVVLSVVVVVAHVSSSFWRIDGFPSSLFYSDLFAR
jgi:hypothetical protein